MTELKKEEHRTQPATNGTPRRYWHFKLPGLKQQLIFWPLMVGGFLLDLWSKKTVFDWLERYRSFSVVNGFLQLVVAENDGAAFGIAGGRTHLLIIVSIVALVIIFAVFLFGRTEQKLVYISLAFLSAGICGNLWDRIFNDGRVRDFIDVVYWPGKHWPAFNVADSLLCIGVGLLIISSYLAPGHSQRH